MAYFLKVSKPNGKDRKYLQIYESFYDPNKKTTAHKSYKALGYEDKLIESGIANPVEYYKGEVDKLNQDNDESCHKLIGDSPKRYLGYFPIKSILNKLDVQRYINYYHLNDGINYEFNLYDVLYALICSRIVKPCSKHRTFNEIIPLLYERFDFSYNQLLEGLEFYGENYENIIELFTNQVKEKYKLNTNTTYFDCTNFYFEIDREDDFRRKGPSKESRKDPLIGMGLLLDTNLIPIGMNLYPGNESEKPILRKVIDNLKKQNNIEGRTIHVADKGLNCANNIYFSKKNDDGYIFSKSVKQLPEKEKVWVLLDNDYKNVKDSNGNILYRYKECVDKFPYDYIEENGKKHKLSLTEKRVVTYNPSLASKTILEIERMVEKAKYLCLSKAKKDEYGEASKYVIFKGKDDSKVNVSINQEKIDEDKRLAGYNLLVTSEIKMKAKDIYDTYHNLWRIEESFKIMKSDLDARPVYLQKENTIKGHFLICYLCVLLERIFQFKILNNKYPSEKIYKFFKEFEVIEADNRYINITRRNDFIFELAELLKLPINQYYLNKKQIEKVLNCKL